MTNSIEEIDESDAIFIIGANPRENHPVIGARIKRAKQNGAKLIIADPRRVNMAEIADVFLQIEPGSNIALINGMMHVIIKEGIYDKEYVDKYTEGFEELKKLVEKYDPQRCAEICGVNAEDIIEAARIYAKAKPASIFYAMGITQHKAGTNGVMTLSNLALLCGNIGKLGAGINPLRGQNSVQGACDMGGLPNVYPGYQKVSDEKITAKFEKLWNTELSRKEGLTIPEMMDAAIEGKIRYMHIFGENPMISDPDINHIKHALEHCEFLIVQDIFMTETAEFADVVLPGLSYAEKDGTFTNTERRVQRIRKAVKRDSDRKADWQVIMDLINVLGNEKKIYNHPSEIMDEISLANPSYVGIDYDRIDNEGLQWPVKDKSHHGTKYLHKNAPIRGRGLFVPSEQELAGEQADDEYPFILTNGRNLYHYHSRTMTGRVDGLNKKSPKSYVEINPRTLTNLGISNGDKVKIISRRGEVITTVVETDRIIENLFFMPFHFADGPANMLTGTILDEKCKIPELKITAVKIEKI
ncbi:formate dehydrogenase major subunit [Brassicibacter mesophilus]